MITICIFGGLIAFALIALLPTPPRRGCGVNDLSRWKQFGGDLERPPPPPPMNQRRN